MIPPETVKTAWGENAIITINKKIKSLTANVTFVRLTAWFHTSIASEWYKGKNRKKLVIQEKRNF